MMAKANVGKARKDWKPPEGYKSALGRARDAAKAAEAKKKKKVAALSGDETEDTASDSEDDCQFSECGFRACALTRHRSSQLPTISPLPRIHSINRLKDWMYSRNMTGRL